MSGAPAFRVLVFGGAGVFGGRLVDGILATTGWDVVVAGRDGARLAAFVAARPGAARPGAARLGAAGRVSAVRLDARRCVPGDICDRRAPMWWWTRRDRTRTRPIRWLAEACIAARVAYVDLADSRRFVAGFGELDGAARASRGDGSDGGEFHPCAVQRGAGRDHGGVDGGGPRDGRDIAGQPGAAGAGGNAGNPVVCGAAGAGMARRGLERSGRGGG